MRSRDVRGECVPAGLFIWVFDWQDQACVTGGTTLQHHMTGLLLTLVPVHLLRAPVDSLACTAAHWQRQAGLWVLGAILVPAKRGLGHRHVLHRNIIILGALGAWGRPATAASAARERERSQHHRGRLYPAPCPGATTCGNIVWGSRLQRSSVVHHQRLAQRQHSAGCRGDNRRWVLLCCEWHECIIDVSDVHLCGCACGSF